MSLTREHLERIIIDRILIDSPEGKRAIHSEPSCHEQAFKSPHQESVPLLSDRNDFKNISLDSLRLDERLPHALLKPLATRIKAVAERYTSSRQNTIPALLENECQAYASYYLLINIEKISRLLKATSYTPPIKNYRVLDYGCGPGTGALALASYGSTPFDLVAVDSNPYMRRIASKLTQDLIRAHVVRGFEVLSPDSPLHGSFDLIIAGHVLNEMPASNQEIMIKMLASHLNKHGTLLVLESALPAQTRELMRIRDLLLGIDPLLNIVFPCSHKRMCPMLQESAVDWCHGSMHWNPPHLIRQLDQLTGFNKHQLKYSALVFSRNTPQPEPSRRRYRVVAPPEQNKAGHSAILCGDDFFGITTLRKRNRSESNIEFRRAEHFDCLDLEGNDTLTSELSPSFAINRQRAP